MASNQKECFVQQDENISPRHRQQFAILTCTERLVHLIAHHIRRLSKLWFAHMFLLTMLIAYAALGGIIFWTVEGYHEKRFKKDLSDTRLEVQRMLWNASQVANSLEEWINVSDTQLKVLESVVRRFAMPHNPDKAVWTFWSAVFYSATVFTSIGYGNIVPSTTLGRALTIAYAIVGIPILCAVLADFGKLLTQGIKFFWCGARLLVHTGSCRRNVFLTKTKKVSNRAFLKQYETANKLQVDSNNSCLDPHVQDKEDGPEDIVSTPPVPYIIDDQFNLPVSIALTTLLGYIMLGGWIFKQWESWTYFESTYFVFISMSTIGFGDYVPEHPMFMMATFVYLLFGLALMSMCINVVQETLTVTFNNASRKIKKRIGISDSTVRPETLELAAQTELAPVHQASPNNKQPIEAT